MEHMDWIIAHQHGLIRTAIDSHNEMAFTSDKNFDNTGLFTQAVAPYAPPSPTQNPDTAPPRMAEVVGLAVETAVVRVQGSRGSAAKPKDVNPKGWADGGGRWRTDGNPFDGGEAGDVTLTDEQ
jgi:hypothetical protein